MHPLSLRLRAAFEAMLEAANALDTTLTTIRKSQPFRTTGYGVYGAPEDPFALLCAPTTVIPKPIAPSSHHQALRIASDQRFYQDAIDTQSATLRSTVVALLGAMRQGPVALHTPYQPQLMCGVGILAPYLSINATTSPTPTIEPSGECWLQQSDTAWRLVMAATFNATIGIGRPWTILSNPSANTTSAAITVCAPTPGDALQWASLLHSNSLYRGHDVQVMGVGIDELTRSRQEAWARIEALL